MVRCGKGETPEGAIIIRVAKPLIKNGLKAVFYTVNRVMNCWPHPSFKFLFVLIGEYVWLAAYSLDDFLKELVGERSVTHLQLKSKLGGAVMALQLAANLFQSGF